MINKILIKVINRYLLMKRSVRLFKKTNTKKVLISYVLVPQYFIPFYYQAMHNNKYKCFLIMRHLFKNGYDIYLYDYLNTQSIDYSIRYDLFIGHNKTFSSILKKIGQDTPNILLATGSSPEFGNHQQIERLHELNKRKKVNLPIFENNQVPDLTENYDIADQILLIGNEFVKKTYNPKYQTKIKLINNVTPHPLFTRKKLKRTNNFLFISSVGQVHRGLDLLLDIFPKLDQKLYILSSFREEKDFVKLFEKELFDTPNIFAIGYLSMTSKKFAQMISEVDFVILPSCSEGQSSSVINMISYGLIPLVPENVGLPNIEEVGIKIESLEVASVQAAIEQAIRLTDEEFNRFKEKIKSHKHLFEKESFLQTFEKILSHE